MFTIHFNYTWEAFDGKKLYAQNWQPEITPKAVICVVHGIGEHSERYSDWALLLNDWEYGVLAIDYRGHGKSEGKRGYIKSYECLMKDIDLLMTKAEELYPNVPKILYGHSLGGNMVLNYVLRRNPKVKAVIASSPWLELVTPPKGLKLAFGRVMNIILPSYTQRRESHKADLTHDAGEIEKYEKDELVHNLVSPRLYFSVCKAGKWAMKNAAKFNVPLLLMHGDEDKVTSHKASEEFARKVKEKSTLKIWKGLRHELHHETKRADVLNYTLQWVVDKA